MDLALSFEHLIQYDPGVPGITLQVEIVLGERVVPVQAKVDTGSDSCIFSRRYGAELGLEIESGEQQQFGTAVGTFTAYGHPITLRTGSFAFDSVVYFAADDSFDRSVLGRFGWLDRMIIGINDYDGKLYLSRHE